MCVCVCVRERERERERTCVTTQRQICWKIYRKILAIVKILRGKRASWERTTMSFPSVDCPEGRGDIKRTIKPEIPALEKGRKKEKKDNRERYLCALVHDARSRRPRSDRVDCERSVRNWSILDESAEIETMQQRETETVECDPCDLIVDNEAFRRVSEGRVSKQFSFEGNIGGPQNERNQNDCKVKDKKSNETGGSEISLLEHIYMYI